MLNRPPPRATITDSARARRSKPPKPSTATTSYPARAADSANPRVETPAMRMRVISRQPQTPSRRVARHHVQMIEHGAACLANAERLDQLAVRAACDPIRDEGGALRALLR